MPSPDLPRRMVADPHRRPRRKQWRACLCRKGLLEWAEMFFKSPCFRTSRPPSLVCPPRGLKRTAAMAAREEIEQAILQTLQTAPIANSMEAAEAMKVDHEL